MMTKQLLKLLCGGSLMIVTANTNAVVVPSLNYIDYACAHMNVTGLPVGWKEANEFMQREETRTTSKGALNAVVNAGEGTIDRSNVHKQTLDWVDAGKPLAIPMRNLAEKLAQEKDMVGDPDILNFKNVITKSDANARASAYPVKIILVTLGAAWIFYRVFLKKSSNNKHEEE